MEIPRPSIYGDSIPDVYITQLNKLMEDTAIHASKIEEQIQAVENDVLKKNKQQNPKDIMEKSTKLTESKKKTSKP